jgi:queuine tRNA-ribosyltransferase
MMLLTEINLAYYQDFMEDMRRAITAGSFTDFCDAAKRAWRAGKTSGKLERYGQSVLA